MRTPAYWRGLSPRRRILLGTLGVAVLLAAVPLTVVRVSSARPERTGSPDQAVAGTVLLIPGYGGARDALNVLADRLRSAGREATVLTLPGDGTGDLSAQVAMLDGAVNEALDDGAPSVDLIGFSAGGVVARLWLQRDGGEHVTRRVVSLGSPLHGTHLAALGGVIAPGVCPPACQQLVPGSDVIGPMERTPLPAGLPWLSMWTEFDHTVTPPETARQDGAVNVPVQQLCPARPVEHGGLPTDAVVSRAVLRALDGATLRAPLPGCD